MAENSTNLLEYLGIEETNLLVSMANFHRDVNYFPSIDDLFQAPLPHVDLKVKDFSNLTDDELHRVTVMSLFLFIQFHLSTTPMLRCHLSDSLASTRKAIDATLTAYRLMRLPESATQYNEGHNVYKFIKSTIVRELRGLPLLRRRKYVQNAATRRAATRSVRGLCWGAG